MIRAFVALEIPAEVLRRLGDVSDQLDLLSLNGRRTRLEGIHLTLKFLGNISEEQVTDLESRLKPAAEAVGPFEVEVAGVGVFPHLTRPRVIWAGVRPSGALTELQQQVESAVTEAGFEKEKRAFRPHLTLFRLKSTRNRDNLVRYLSRSETPRFGKFQAREFHLFQSKLKPGGAEYSKLISWPLTGEPESGSSELESESAS